MDVFLLLSTLITAAVLGYVLGLRKAGQQKEAPTIQIIYDEDDDEEGILPCERPNDEPKKNKGPHQLIVVSYRLPIKVWKNENNKWQMSWSSARAPLANLRRIAREETPEDPSSLEVHFIGTPGVFIPKAEQEDFEDALRGYNCTPVFLPEDLEDEYYNGFCKSVLWPLLHYVMPHTNEHFWKEWDHLWQAYQRANMLFAKTVESAVDSEQYSIWVHDYPILLACSFLRKNMPRANIGFFMHTPFPTSDVFRLLPNRENILRGFLSCDLIGFHTYDYARHFLSAAKRILDVDYEILAGGTIALKYSGRRVSCMIRHVGIRSNVFRSVAKSPDVKYQVQELGVQFKDRTIILSVTDVSVLRGASLQLQAYEQLLKKYPEHKENVVLLIIFLPRVKSRIAPNKDVPGEVSKAVRNIQSKYGKECVHIINDGHQSVEAMVALYRASKVAFISSVYDGLNLVPFEYTASQDPENPGQLVLSEFMGCVRSLSGAIRVNPWAIDETADVIHDALKMTRDERKYAHQRRYKYVMAQTLERWALNFLGNLERATRSAETLNFVQVGWGSNVRLVGLRADFTRLSDAEVSIATAYSKAQKRILLLDYDGTLTGDSGSPSDELKAILRQLTLDPLNHVFLISGRERKDLAEWFGDIPDLGLAAEKGCFLKWPERLTEQVEKFSRSGRSHSIAPKINEKSPLEVSRIGSFNSSKIPNKGLEWHTFFDYSSISAFKAEAAPIMKEYTACTDGSYVEMKESAMVWHYEGADPVYGKMQANEMLKYLEQVLDSSMAVVRYDYNRILEVKPVGLDKGTCVDYILNVLEERGINDLEKGEAAAEQPFILCVGDDVSDEFMFKKLQGYYQIKEAEDAAEVTPGRKEIFIDGIYPVCVGVKPSSASYYLQDPDEVLSVIKDLINCSNMKNRNKYPSCPQFDEVDASQSDDDMWEGEAPI